MSVSSHLLFFELMENYRLAEFLEAANKATYANREAPKVESLRPASEDYHFEQGNLVYHDTYFGSRDFIGEEIIYEDGRPVWGMNYYGHVLKESISTQDAYAILRPALMQEYDDILPVRGPREYIEDNKRYINNVDGELDRFSGTEEIYIDNEVAYRCWYHGGLIQ